MSIFPYVQQKNIRCTSLYRRVTAAVFLAQKKYKGPGNPGPVPCFLTNKLKWSQEWFKQLQVRESREQISIAQRYIKTTIAGLSTTWDLHREHWNSEVSFPDFEKIKGLGFRLCKQWNSQRWHCILLRLETLGAQPLVLPLISWQEPQENYLLSLEFHDIYKVYVSLRDIWGTKRHDIAQYLHFTFLKFPSRTQKWCQRPIKWDCQVSPSCRNYSCSCNKNTWNHKINQEIFFCYDAPSAPGPYTTPTNTCIMCRETRFKKCFSHL